MNSTPDAHIFHTHANAIQHPPDAHIFHTHANATQHPPDLPDPTLQEPGRVLRQEPRDVWSPGVGVVQYKWLRLQRYTLHYVVVRLFFHLRQVRIRSKLNVNLHDAPSFRKLYST